MYNRRPIVKKGNKKTYGARTVKKTVLERRNIKSSKKGRPMREMRAKRPKRGY